VFVVCGHDHSTKALYTRKESRPDKKETGDAKKSPRASEPNGLSGQVRSGKNDR
jgi:hypothetical protein